MSCIASLIHNDDLYMASDSGVYLDEHKIPSDNPQKVFWKGAYLFGMIGSVRCTQILQYAVPNPKITDDLADYFCTEFTPQIREALSNMGRRDTDEEGSDSVQAGIMIGVRHKGYPKLYVIGHDYSVLEISENFYAMGCGYEYVMGYLEARRTTIGCPGTVLREALSVAAKYTVFVGEPIHITALSEKPQPAPMLWGSEIRGLV
jgi:ATP-dependent protease HslVU (ClpYQ) peptidase subunit